MPLSGSVGSRVRLPPLAGWVSWARRVKAKSIETVKVPVSRCATFCALGATFQFVIAVLAYLPVFAIVAKYANGMSRANVATPALPCTPSVIRCAVEEFFAILISTLHTLLPHKLVIAGIPHLVGEIQPLDPIPGLGNGPIRGFMGFTGVFMAQFAESTLHVASWEYLYDTPPLLLYYPRSYPATTPKKDRGSIFF